MAERGNTVSDSTRKKKKKHIKLHTVGGNVKLQFGPRIVKIVVTIPRQHLAKRLS